MVTAKGYRGRCPQCGRDMAIYDLGLCATCYHLTRDSEGRADHARPPISADDLLDELVHFQALGYTWRQVADRLGMRRTSFYRALLRARRAGDKRAQYDGMRESE